MCWAQRRDSAISALMLCNDSVRACIEPLTFHARKLKITCTEQTESGGGDASESSYAGDISHYFMFF